MDGFHKDEELDEIKTAMEKLKEDYRIKTELYESLRNSHNEQLIQIQEAKTQIEKQAQELNAKVEENSLLWQKCEDLKSTVQEKESVLRHLSSANDKLRADCGEKLHKLEGENRELLTALDEANMQSRDQEEKIRIYKDEIEGLKGLLSVSQKKCFDAQQRAQAPKELRQRDDLLLKLEEEKSKVDDQLKWKKEQFKHLEEAHQKIQDQFRASKREWELERSSLVDEICSLQTSLDSQTRISEDLQSRLKMCNQALAHEESRRKILELQLLESKASYENVFTKYEEAKSKIENLTIQRNEEIAALRNSLGGKAAMLKEMEFIRGQLEHENQDLRQSLRELQEANINKTGSASSLAKLRNKLKGLEQIHKDCFINLKAREAEWNSQIEKLAEELNECRSELDCKDKNVQKLQRELESCYSSISQSMLKNEELSVMLTVLHSSLSEAHSKLSNVMAETELSNKDTEEQIKLLKEQLEEKKSDLVKSHAEIKQEREKAESLAIRIESLDLIEKQHFLTQQELERFKAMLKESSELNEQSLKMQNALKEELRKVSDALDKINFELAEKSREEKETEFELDRWKSVAERLKVCLDENQEFRKEMEASLLAQAETEQTLKQEREKLIRALEDKEKRVDHLQQKIVLLKQELKVKETSTLAKTETEKAFEEEKEKLLLLVTEKDKSIDEFQQEVSWLEQEFARRELEGAILARTEAEKDFEKEKERLILIAEEKDQSIECLQQLVTSLKQDFTKSVKVAVLSELEEKQSEISMLHKAWEKIIRAMLLAEVEIQEKNLVIGELEDEINNFHKKLELQDNSLSHSTVRIKQLEAVLEGKQLEIEKIMDSLGSELRISKGLVEEIESEKILLLRDIKKLSSERETLLAHIEFLYDQINEFSNEEAELMGSLGRIVQKFDPEDGQQEMDLKGKDELYDSNRENVNKPLSTMMTKVEASHDVRSPFREVNN
ncbi:PREDICTED: uncharacterized protein At4g38062 [Nelumbo nucifera]|uniref:Uncharacterized protein n=2 Tax=Nelumbo nucifera TaxID=4432 RepID=A0A822Z3H4_NELNU|nr:PREDICTED: uncharacterized protein At4g38062 [Nelumbo nucifera]DAD40944.1 TPA_asm: hypothetical protein HUJ06_015267 [Nelumbo nucifera]